MNQQDFYIGWMSKAPKSFAKHVKRVLLILFPVALIVVYLLSTSQKKFSTASFEYGKLTEVKGIYYNKPVPMLKVFDKNNLSITIPLVGYGKHGAETAIMELEKEKGVSLNGKEVTIKGTLIYGDGKTLLQVDKNDDPIVNIGAESTVQLQQKELSTQTIRGEIVDPKCYFGVMKPGEGKVHRDCAIRCILGGIPPVLHVQNEKGESNYYLIVGPNGEKINEALQDIVAEPVSIEARVVQQDDWIILYTSKENIKRISYTQLKDPTAKVIACASVMQH
ncbi:MAG TPA: hypothetical protein VK492_15405 [Chitinophagaceae bacterium]|nr:hypothetical protein [Chitinophagaceae bacterium]